MTPSWNKWIVLSIADYTQTYLSGEYLWVQGTVRQKNEPSQRYELRFLGPDVITHTEDSTELHLTINCQISTVRTPDNVETHLMRVGKVQCMLAQCISAYKFGKDPVLDDRTLFGHLQQISNVDTTSFGTVDPVSSVERSTVEATYKVVL